MSSNQTIHEHLLNVAQQHHPDLARVIRANGVIKFRKSKDKDLFYFLARTLAGQQLSTAAAQTIWSRVEELASDRDYSVFELCIKRNEKKLRDCGLSANKVKALIKLNTAFAKDEISYAQIAKANYEEVVSAITQLWGFGPWSADMVAMFFLYHPDVWPQNDVALIRGMRCFIGNKKDPAKVAARFSPYRTYLARHIWIGLDTGIIFDV